MTELHYVQVEGGQFMPINIRPCGVKCFTCGDQCPADKLSQHLASHVQPKYNQPQTTENRPNKLNLGKMLEDDKEDSDLGVQSILPGQIPQTDKRRKTAILPVGKKEDIDHDLTASDILIRSESRDISSNFVPDRNYPEQPNEPELNCFTKIRFQPEKVKVQKKAIKLYENQNTTGQIYDEGGSKSRQRNVPQISKKEYEIKKLHYLEDTQASSDRMNVSTYNITTRRKDPMSTTKISTFAVQQNTVRNRRHGHDGKNHMQNSTVVPYTPIRDKHRDDESSNGSQMERQREKDDHKNRRNRPTEQQSNDGDHHGHQRLACSSCKGFYCRQCKSTIPAIYRPVPDENGKYHMHPDAEAMQFYRKHYYGHKNDNVCTNCEGLKMPK